MTSEPWTSSQPLNSRKHSRSVNVTVCGCVGGGGVMWLCVGVWVGVVWCDCVWVFRWGWCDVWVCGWGWCNVTVCGCLGGGGVMWLCVGVGVVWCVGVWVGVVWCDYVWVCGCGGGVMWLCVPTNVSTLFHTESSRWPKGRVGFIQPIKVNYTHTHPHTSHSPHTIPPHHTLTYPTLHTPYPHTTPSLILLSTHNPHTHPHPHLSHSPHTHRADMKELFSATQKSLETEQNLREQVTHILNYIQAQRLLQWWLYFAVQLMN